jgi:hypothetical protein
MSLATLDQSKIRIRKRREMVGDRTLYGVVDTAGPGGPRVLNLADESLKGSPEFRRSGISKANQLPGPRRRVYQGGAGTINFELAPGPQSDEIIEEGMCAEFTAALGISEATISAAASDNSLNGSGGSEFASVLAGQWITIGGFTGGNDNNTDGVGGVPLAAYVVSKPSDAKLILAYHTLTDEAAGDTVTVEGLTCRNGTTLISSTYEREQTDATTDRFQHYPGTVMSSIEFQLTFNEILKVVAQVVSMSPRGFVDPADETGSGKADESVWNGLTDVTESVVDKTTDMSNNVRAFRDGGALSGNIKALTINHQLNVEPIQAGMVTDPLGQSLGTKGLTGSLSGYLIDENGRVVKAFNSTPTDFHFMVIPDEEAFGADAPIYIFTVYQAVFNEMGDSPKASAIGPTMLDLNFECDESPDYPDVWLQVTKIPTVAA